MSVFVEIKKKKIVYRANTVTQIIGQLGVVHGSFALSHDEIFESCVCNHVAGPVCSRRPKATDDNFAQVNKTDILQSSN